MMGWAGRLGIVIALIIIEKASPALALFLVIVAIIGAIGFFLYKGAYLPQFALNVVDRLTGKQALEKAQEEQSTRLTTINAEELASKLKAKVIGQDAVIDQISAQLRRRVAAKRKEKPLAVFCFAGAPGVGKTYLAKMLAQALYADKNHIHHVDMAQAQQQHAVSSLFGSPKGYVGATTYGSLTAALRDVPNSIILLDEFEKAHPDVHKRFLTAWNDGFITEVSDGAKVATNEAIFILTTNAASRRIGELARDHKGTPEELDRVIKSTLADAQFAPEVLSRIDEIFAFREMKDLDIARVFALEIEDLTSQFDLEIAQGGIDPEILLDAIEKITKVGMDGGVRVLKRAIEKKITDGLIDAKVEGAKKVRLVADGENVLVIPVKDDPPSKVTAPNPAPAVAAQ